MKVVVTPQQVIEKVGRGFRHRRLKRCAAAAANGLVSQAAADGHVR